MFGSWVGLEQDGIELIVEFGDRRGGAVMTVVIVDRVEAVGIGRKCGRGIVGRVRRILVV